jgi:4-diphosphocytidyl-2-C-methyl-D-erythritol kinase
LGRCVITEIAKAKLNLTLGVLGRRPDGYHELVSFVAFVEIGDAIAIDPVAPFALEIDGPFAAGIVGENLVAKACRLVTEAVPGVRLGSIRLTKNLPVAAGLGGGSADAAAVLRALVRSIPGLATRIDLLAIARNLGADVTVCLGQRPSLMWGIGERVTDLPPLPDFWVVLANPGVPLTTADVFGALGARPFVQAAHAPALPGIFASLEDLLRQMRAEGNDLQATGLRLCPAIGDVLSALMAQPGCRLASQSGSGPTCFGVFANEHQARSASAEIAAAHPVWWVRSAPIDPGRASP